MDLNNLIEMSRRYGGDENYVIAGGGNTSYKECGGVGGAASAGGDSVVMAVKASGGALGAIGADGFVLMDVGKLRGMTKADYPEADDEREACAIKDMMGARLPNQGEKRPSVECILHALFPQPYVLHVHPAIVNGLSCGVRGAECAERIFADMKAELIWIPLTKPGFILSKACADAFEKHRSEYGAYPSILLLQNHGIFVAGDSVEEIDRGMAEIVSRIKSNAGREPDFSEGLFAAFPDGEQKGTFVSAGAEISDVPGAADGGADADLIAGIASALKSAYGDSGGSVGGGGDGSGANRPAFATYQSYGEMSRLLESRETAKPLMKPFTPDHIVYDKAYPLWLSKEIVYAGDSGGSACEAIRESFHEFVDRQGFKPKVALVEGLGAFTLGNSAHEADTAAALLMDAARVAAYSEAFGGPLALPDDFTKFIMGWEIESYRQKKSLSQ